MSDVLTGNVGSCACLDERAVWSGGPGGCWICRTCGGVVLNPPKPRTKAKNGEGLYRYRDAVKRREYLRNYMRKRRAKASPA